MIHLQVVHIRQVLNVQFSLCLNVWKWNYTRISFCFWKSNHAVFNENICNPGMNAKKCKKHAHCLDLCLMYWHESAVCTHIINQVWVLCMCWTPKLICQKHIHLHFLNSSFQTLKFNISTLFLQPKQSMSLS